MSTTSVPASARVIRPRVAVVRGGRPVVIRRLRPSDEAAAGAMLQRCSAPSRRFRFHTAMPRVPASFVRDLVTTDGERRQAIVALAAGKLIGLAHFGAAGKGTTEVGLLIEDEWQRHGVGSALLESVLVSARRLGSHTILAYVSHENAAALAMMRRRFPDASRRLDGTVVEMRAPIAGAWGLSG